MKNKKFEENFLEYKNLIIRVVMDKTGDYQAAQEICQQIFVSLYTNMEHVAPDLVKAWLIKSTQNAIVDYHRRAKVKKEIIDDMPLHQSESVVAESTLDICEDKWAKSELAGKILREVKQVNEQWYEVLMLHCVEGLSYAEAAEKLGMSETVLRARVCRARAYIRKRFGDEYMKL